MDGSNELVRIWQLIVELGDQLEQNKILTQQLHSKTDTLQVRPN